MGSAKSFEAPAKVASIAFQPILPGPAHPARGLLLWGIPAAVLQGTIAAAVLWLSAQGRAVETVPDETVYIVDLPTEVSVPKPPPPPAPPRLEPRVEPDVKGFESLPMPTIALAEIPPPVLGEVTLSPLDFSGEGFEGGRAVTGEAVPTPLDAAPTFTPYTVAPWLKNTREVARALQREYPSSLRDAGIGAQVLMWLFIDETGRVQRTVVKTSSGFEALDAAAARVAETMEFAPAVNRDRRVAVWVAVPIDFEVS